MTGRGAAPDTALPRLLRLAMGRRLVEADAEAGIARIAELAGTDIPAKSWHDAVAEARRQGLIHDPVRLAQGALQCHWALELTPRGLDAARADWFRTGSGIPP